MSFLVNNPIGRAMTGAANLHGNISDAKTAYDLGRDSAGVMLGKKDVNTFAHDTVLNFFKSAAASSISSFAGPAAPIVGVAIGMALDTKVGDAAARGAIDPHKVGKQLNQFG